MNSYSRKINVSNIYKELSSSYAAYSYFVNIFNNLLIDVAINHSYITRTNNFAFDDVGLQQLFAHKKLHTTENYISFFSNIQSREHLSVALDVYTELSDFMNMYYRANKVNVFSLSIKKADTLEIILKHF